MNEIIIAAVQLAITIIAFLVGKYVFPKVTPDVLEKLEDIEAWAAKFVVWAREFLKSETGEEKMQKVVEKLQEVAAEAGLNVTEDQLKAIAQSAYEAMMAGATTIEDGTTLEAITQPAATIIINNTGTTAAATDDVPDGALEDNTDGSNIEVGE